MRKLPAAALILALAATGAAAQINAGEQKPEPGLPFTMTRVATFNLPWRIAFLPDGRMLITKKVGPLWLVTPNAGMSVIAFAMWKSALTEHCGWSRTPIPGGCSA